MESVLLSQSTPSLLHKWANSRLVLLLIVYHLILLQPKRSWFTRYLNSSIYFWWIYHDLSYAIVYVGVFLKKEKTNCFFSYERLCGWIVNSFLLHLHLLERLHLPIYEPLATLAGSFWNFSTLCSHCLYRFTGKFNPKKSILKERVRLAYVDSSQFFPWDSDHIFKNYRKMSNFW